MKLAYRAAAVTACLALIVVSDRGRAESCPPGTQWDGQRCTAAPTVTPSTPSLPVSACVEGQVMTSGHCCWPAQVWGDETGRCRGVPACPPSMKVSGEGCVVECEEPRRLSLGHCCFPGQEWSKSLGRCVGAASCPSDWTPSEDGCLRVCPEGHAAVDGTHCCWPGQTFVGDSCRGTPSCAAPFRRDGDTCIGPQEIAKRAVEEEKAAAIVRAQERVALGGEGTFSLLAFTYFSVGTPAGSRASFADWHAHLHLPAIPVEMHAGLGAGSFSGSNGEKVDLSHWTLGAAIAPFSFPNAATHAFSFFNPSAGVAVHRLVPRSFSKFGEANSSLAAEFGNTIILQGRQKDSTIGYGVALRFGYLTNLSGDSAYTPSSGFYIGLMLGPMFDSL